MSTSQAEGRREDALVKQRNQMREEFEKHRYVNNLQAVDVLITQSHMEFQETLNFWKQLSHVMKYFRKEEDPTARLPKNFMQGFLEVSFAVLLLR